MPSGKIEWRENGDRKNLQVGSSMVNTNPLKLVIAPYLASSSADTCLLNICPLSVPIICWVKESAKSMGVINTVSHIIISASSQDLTFRCI